jgi:hypothetical protein
LEKPVLLSPRDLAYRESQHELASSMRARGGWSPGDGPNRLASMTKAELHEIVDQLPEDALEGASLLLKRVAMHQLDPAQAWVWTDEWQAKLNASLVDLQRERIQHYWSSEEFLEAL